MKRVLTILAVLMMGSVLSSMAFAAEEVADATIKMTQGQVAAGIGWSWGKGVLSFQGKDHPFKVKGLSIIDVGITSADAAGYVYHLKNLSDFNGTYTSAAAEGTLGGGAGVKAMKNQHGVVIQLKSNTQGVSFKLAPEGVKLMLKE